MPVLGKHLRLERPVVPAGQRQRAWRMLPNGEHVTVWEMSQADALDELPGYSSKRQIFHIDFVDGVVKGCRAIFFGETYLILAVSDSSKRLRGLELRCVKEP